ncbi:MAG TPA: ROK family transcriptional regulator [Thermoleophilaceae bacterium]
MAVKGTPSLLRTLNQGALMQRLRDDGPLSRAQLARDTGLSKPTVSQALAELEAAGLVRAVGPAAPSRGRTALLYEPDPTAGYVIGIDIGRAWIRVAVADLAGAIIARSDTANRARTAAAVVRAVAREARATVKQAGIGWKRVVHTVVGSPGVFDPSTGRLWHAPNLPDWSKPGLADELRDALTPSTAIENDANLAAVGERDFGRGREARNFVYVELGTGLGVGVVIDGEIHRGARGAAGEVGYIPWPGTARSERGRLEEATSAAAVVASARAAGMRGDLTAKDVFDAARAGDAKALRAVDEEAVRVAHLLATITAVVDPEFIVLGGGIGASADLLRPRIEESLRELTPLETRVEESELGQDAIVVGAIATALEAAREIVFEERLAA